MYIKVVSDERSGIMESAFGQIEFIGENDVGNISFGECDMLIIDYMTANRLAENNISVKIGGVETVIAASERILDLREAIEGVQYVVIPQYGKEEIEKAIDDIVTTVKQRRAKENFERMVLEEAERVKPILQEQFLRDYILGVGDADELFKIYCKAFDVEQTLKTRLIIMKTEPEAEFDEQFFIRNLTEGYLGKRNILLSTAVPDGDMFLMYAGEEDELVRNLKKAANALERYYGYKANIVYSNKCDISDMPEVYAHLKRSMSYCFYSENEHIVYVGDIKEANNELRLEPDYSAIVKSLKSCDEKRSLCLIDEFFRQIEEVRLESALAKTYCLELYVCVIRCCETEKIDRYMKGLMEFQALKTLGEIRSYITAIAKEIIEANLPEIRKNYSALISDTIRLIEENLGNEKLSLRWLAGNILYTNVDYLGKLFKKEVGENFSHYVMTKRMETAKQLIINGERDKIYEVAEKVGYGANSQYFSQVFKKYTGLSPLEYKEFSKQKKQA